MTLPHVSAIILSCFIGLCIHYAIDTQIGKIHGCHSPPRLPNQRPFGIDRLEQIFRANTESRLMELFLFHFRLWGTTLEQEFLRTRAIGTIDPRNLQAILSTNFQDWSMGARHKLMSPLLGDGIFTQEGAAWKHSRELLRPHFMHKQYEDLEIFRDALDTLIDVMPKQGVVDLQPLFFRLTLDVTTAFLFGESVNSLKPSESSNESTFANAFNIAQDFIAKRMRLQSLYWLVRGSKFTKACDDVHRFADHIIDRNLSRTLHHEKERSRYVLLDSIAKDTQDRTALRSQIINLLIAGRDTTACALSWTFFLLARHPRVMAILRAEIASAINSGAVISRAELKNMIYLQKVLRETLRLYPPVPVNSRTAVRTTILPVGGGTDLKSPVLVPKGMSVAWSAYALHREQSLYGMDAELFRPERWDEMMKDDAVKLNWGYLPFNGGPRACLGMDFGLTELAYTIVRLLEAFPTIQLPPAERVELLGAEKQKMTLVMSITGGCRVELSQ